MTLPNTKAIRRASEKLKGTKLFRFLFIVFAIIVMASYNAMVTGRYAREQLSTYSNFAMDVGGSGGSDKHADSGSLFVPNLERVRRRVLKVLGERQFNAVSNPSIKTVPSSARKQEKQDPEVKMKRKHYRSTRFELSPDRPLFSSLNDFTFRPVDLSPGSSTSSSDSWIKRWKMKLDKERKHDAESSSPSSRIPKCVERVVCHVNREYRNLLHWQHYMHFAFPCWSLFKRFPDAKEYVINIGQTEDWKGHKYHPWITSLHKYFHNAGILFENNPPGKKNDDEPNMLLFPDPKEQVTPDKSKVKMKPQKPKKTMKPFPGPKKPKKPKKPVGRRRLSTEKQRQNPQCDWMANTNLNFDGMGFQQPDGKTPYHNSYYFMNPEDLYELQKTVLGANFHSGPSMMRIGDDDVDDRKFRVTVLNRENTKGREWWYAHDAYRMIDEAWGDVLDVEYVPGYDNYSFEDQANHMHSRDVFISPHGAQLTNTVFIRPCTVVLELLPPKFYHPKKTALVMEAGGVGFYGYLHGGSPIADTCAHDPETGRCTDGDWALWRDIPYIWASPESIVFDLPTLLQAGLDCRAQWAATHAGYENS